MLARSGSGPAQRKAAALPLARVYSAAVSTGQAARVVVFGSFATSRTARNDVDVFLLMHDELDFTQVQGEGAPVFDHLAAQSQLCASAFSLRSAAAWQGEYASIETWQATRGAGVRGVIERISKGS